MSIRQTVRSRRSILASLTLPLLASVGMKETARAAPNIATVVSTRELAIRSCATRQCQTIERVPLGDTVEIIEQGDGGFVRVSHGGVTGYASYLFLATDPGHVPFLASGEPGCRQVAFIFNIGVGFEPASGILDTLAAEEVPATMFAMGWWASEHPALLTRMAEERYVIGSHGNWPQELTELADDEVAADLQRAVEAIEHATGQPPAPYFTPYAAAIDDRVRAIVAASGVLPVAWEVPAADYGPDATADAVYDRVMGEIYDGAIVELHLDGPASAESTGRALPLMIRDLRAQGFRFVTIPDLIEPCS
jgi:peptidoglycan/xylan/chitin deacetylase (PgdA/CDA1 family)